MVGSSSWIPPKKNIIFPMKMAGSSWIPPKNHSRSMGWSRCARCALRVGPDVWQDPALFLLAPATAERGHETWHCKPAIYVGIWLLLSLLLSLLLVLSLPSSVSVSMSFVLLSLLLLFLFVLYEYNLRVTFVSKCVLCFHGHVWLLEGNPIDSVFDTKTDPNGCAWGLDMAYHGCVLYFKALHQLAGRWIPKPCLMKPGG